MSQIADAAPVDSDLVTVPSRSGAAPAPASPVSRTPSWLHVAESIHGCDRTLAPVVADAMIALVVGLVAGLSVLTTLAFALGLLVAFDVAGVYEKRTSLETQGLQWYVARAGTPFVLVALMLLVAANELDSKRATWPAIVVVGGGLLALRLLTWAVVATARRAGLGRQAAIVVGSGSAAHAVKAKLEAHASSGLVPVGVLVPDSEQGAGEGVAVGCRAQDLPELIPRAGITHVVLAPEGRSDLGVTECIELCHQLDVDVSVRPPLGDLFLRPAALTRVGGMPLVTLGRVTRTRPARPGKRVFDIVAALVLLVVCAPVMALTAILIKLGDGGPALFRQRRVGYRGTVFSMLKFRTMVEGAEQLVVSLRDRNSADGLLFKIRGDPRVTRIGRFLRRHSIDELPQLWNVLRGDMSLVGPRPLPVRPEDFGPLDGHRHVVPPGITGYWQIAPTDGLTYREMVRLDLAYVQEWSLWVDVAILARTVPALLRRYRGPDL